MLSSSLIPLFGTALLAAALSFLLLLTLLRTGWAWALAVDMPNHRSLHVRPVPRVGGWGVLPVTLLFIALDAPALYGIGLAALLLGAVSQIDDRRGLSARVRFAAHVVAVAIAIVTGSVDLAWWWALVLGVALVWLVNLYNFMDGVNGLAGGMTVIGFATYALAAGPAQPQLMLVCAAVAGAGLGFLVLNFSPARIFLGDAGSIPLGFLAGALGFWGWQHGAWPLWFPALVFAPFIADASVTLLRRLARGERFWQAHREHYYQRLVQMGHTHGQVALRYYVLMLGGAGVAWLAWSAPAALQWVLLALWYGVLALAGWRVDGRWRRVVEPTEKE